MRSKIFTNWSLIWILATPFFVVGAFLNLLQRSTHDLPPTDGIIWVQKPEGIFVEEKILGYAGDRAGVFVGDRLIGISLDGKIFEEIKQASDIQLYLEVAGVGGSLSYSLERTSYSFSDRIYIAELTKLDPMPRWTPTTFFLTLVGFFWLGVGFFVFFKQGAEAPFVLHFAVLCLVAFIFHVYKPLGLGEDFDLAVSLIDDLAFAFFAPIFLHFCLRYPVQTQVFIGSKTKTLSIYLLALAVSILNLFFSLSLSLPLSDRFKERLIEFINAYDVFDSINQALLIHFIIGVSLGAICLVWRFVKISQPIVRQRLKWVIWGTVAAALPIIGLQIIRRLTYLPDDYLTAAFSTLPLTLIPLSLGHSVIRYRLMDVDIVVRRAVVYVLTTLTIALMIGTLAFGLVLLTFGENFSRAEIFVRVVVSIIAMAAIVMLSEPLKNFLQERVDRFFYGERYDLRRGLLDFSKTISATTRLESLLNSLIERLQQVLDVEKVAIFIEDETTPSGYRLVKAVNLNAQYTIPSDFKQKISIKASKKGAVRADELEMENGEVLNPFGQELHYFVPCIVRGRMIAIIGLGRTSEGALLSSEDLDILRTISGYIAVAIENSLLYQEQEKRAQELELLKEFNESIVESVNVGLLATDENGIITHCNSSFEEMFCLQRKEVIGKSVTEIFDKNFLRQLAEVLGDSKWTLKEPCRAYKLTAENYTGKTLILNVGIAPLRSSRRSGNIIVLEDVTMRVRLEEQLQQSEKLSSIGLLAAGVAHEVNTPLTGVSSYTQMLLQMVPEADPKYKILQKIQKQTERAANIVSNLLNFARSTNNGQKEFTEIEVNRILEDTLQLLEPQLRRSKIEVIRNYNTKLPKILGNAGKLQQVFTNLILNAIDAMSNGGTLKLNTGYNEECVFIEIADTGVGIEEKNLGKIYDPFFTTKPVGSGTGLGLAVTYGIVQEHSGKIEVFSQIGKGTTFRLEFPLAAEMAQLQDRKAV
jgi:two-component system, NtrC family, sensor kinase